MSLIYGDNFINQTSFPVNSRDNLENLFTIINEVFSSLHTYQKDKDYE